MKKKNLLYLVIILIIIFMRISVMIVPEVDIKFFGFVVHHFWFGVIFAIVGFAFPGHRVYSKIFLYGIGMGLMADQLIFMILGAGKDREYWALPSLLGAFVIVLGIYPIRARVSDFLLGKH